MYFFNGTILTTLLWIKTMLQLILLIKVAEVSSRRTTRWPRNGASFGSANLVPTSTEVFNPPDPMSDHSDLHGKYDWFQPLLKHCRLQVPDEENIILSYSSHHTPLMKSDVLIPHGTTIIARCPLLGQMKLIGPSSVHCNNGKWSEKLPTCLPTTPTDGLSAFLDDHPPTIITNVPLGSAGENNAGELVVRPLSVVHLDCVFYRRLGNPIWTWNKHSKDSRRTYPFGWAIAREERLWRFRISIFSIEAKDAGEYTCITPHGHTNSIRIIVQTIQCKTPEHVELPLKTKIEGTYAGQKISFSCLEGYRLLGPNSSICLTSGMWSQNQLPTCELIQCSYDIDGADPRLEFDFLNGVGYKAMVKFSCPPGYHLIGSTNATCREDMNWFPSPPFCEVVECAELLPPLNGRIIDSRSSHFVGDIVKFSCNRNFQLMGQSEITCTENGTWSFPAPQCKMFCSHPGTPSFGSLIPDNPVYEIGTSVHISCNFGTKLQGRKWLMCQQDAKWSSSIGQCTNDVANK